MVDDGSEPTYAEKIRVPGGYKIENRHILIIAMSEHHVDYMNRKAGHSVIMQGGLFTDVYIR